MERHYTEEKNFDTIDFSVTLITPGDYENCSFINCNFANTNLSNLNFNGCRFNDCNLSMATLAKTAFRDTEMVGCKLLGLHFELCSEFGLTIKFDNCILNHASFYKRKLKQTIFKNCKIHEADFTGADLTEAVFDNCDLSRTIFNNSILEKVDFRTSYNYSIDPELNRLKKARFSIPAITGLLDKYDIKI